ncbi:DUF4097 family beta strand repeat-containing protein [Streptomyces sp. GC420]|uniref:DUF4097 family beta strand repeat-containing protein n=1 Tax=Streptomyces sp. GC420 TaxID=2697568 RepID=UPI001414CE58|nr:DUF4097 family beta strand repeat-containing protein [Streptomyces sp. GC420]NBM16485.1 DUF4097 family beta strand repeat protein [Streptomyces sp. GC420]
MRVRRTFAAVGGGLVTALLVAGCGSSNAAEEDDTPERKAFSFGGRILTIEADGSEIELAPADVEDVEVTRWFTGWTALGESPKVTWGMKGSTLTFRTECDALINDCAAKHAVKVPRGVAVVVENDNGKVTASGFGTSLKLRSDNGKVVVRDSSGALELKSDNGEVVAEAIGSAQVRADSENGAVRLAFTEVPDRVEAGSDNGEVRIELPRATYRVSAGSDNGDADVSVPRSDTSGHVVEAHSDNGEVTVRSAN